MSFEKLSKELEIVTATANRDIEAMHFSVRPTWAVAIQNAKDRLVVLKALHKEALLQNGVAIFVEGDKEKVSQVISQMSANGGITVDASELYTRLANEIEPTLSDARTWGVAQTHKLHLGLQEVMSELGLSEMPMPARDSMPVVKDPAATAAHVKEVIHGAMGSSLNALYVEAQAAKTAFEIRYIGVTAPVLIYNAAQDEEGDLGKSFAKGSVKAPVSATDEVNEEFLGKLMKDVSKRISRKK